jgi:hypothetical protein
VVHESRWRQFVDGLVAFRRTLRVVYGMPVRTEIHAAEMINGKFLGMAKHVRLAILRNALDELAKFTDVSITNVVVDKRGKPPTYDVFEQAWQVLFQRFENTLRFGNFPGGFKSDNGIVMTDATNGEKLTRLVRRLSVVNFIPNQASFGSGSRNIPIARIVEDPIPKDSEQSLPIQMCDVVAYFLKQKMDPNGYMKKHGAQNYFGRLRPVLNLNASRTDSFGIVRL